MALKQKLDYSDLAGTPDDGLRYEILDGDLFGTPSPSIPHQRVSRELQRQLVAYFHPDGRGEVFDALLDVILSPHDVVEPDLIVVTQASQFSQRGIEGAPTLVVEILSPSTKQRDRTVKVQIRGTRRPLLLDSGHRRSARDLLPSRRLALRRACRGGGRCNARTARLARLDPGARRPVEAVAPRASLTRTIRRAELQFRQYHS